MCLVTAVRDRESDLDERQRPVPWDHRPIAGSFRGLPWWGAIALGFGLAILGAAVDILMFDKPELIFKASYFIGSIGAVAAVRRRHLFGPMVQPPLILALVVPGVVLYGGGIPENSDSLARILAVSTPLINGFPTMAITTVATLVIGIFRIFRERDPNREGDKSPKSKLKAGAAELADEGTELVDRESVRRSASTRRPGSAVGPTPARAAGATGATPRSAVTPSDRPQARSRHPAVPDEQATRIRRAATPEEPTRGRRAADPDVPTRARRPVTPDEPTRARRPVDPPPGRRARIEENRARPLEPGEPRTQRPRASRQPDTERPRGGERPGPDSPSGRWRVPGDAPNWPAQDSQPLPGPGLNDEPPRRAQRRRQPPPPPQRPWDDDQG